MMRKVATGVLVAGLVAAIILIGRARLRNAELGVVVVRGARLVDGTGRAPLDNATVVIENGRIREVFRDREVGIPSGARIIDAGGRTILPGLIDSQVHLVILSGGSASSNQEFTPNRILADLKSNLFWGVTTVRSAGDTLNWALNLRESESNNPSTSPRLYVVGPILTAAGGYPNSLPSEIALEATRQIDDADQATTVVHDLASHRVDMIKVVYQAPDWWDDYQKLSEPLLRKIVEEAHNAGLRVSVRARSAAEVKEAVLAGADGIEHDATELLDTETIQLIAKRGVYYCPALAAKRSAAMSIEEADELLSDREVTAHLASEVRDPLQEHKGYWFELNGRPEVIEHFRSAFKISQANVLAASRAGVKVVLGTSAGEPLVFHGAAAHEELRLMVASGLTPMEAIVAATRTTAEYLGINDQAGTIEPGKLADLIIVERDPLGDITATRNILQVIKGGRVIDRRRLTDR